MASREPANFAYANHSDFSKYISSGNLHSGYSAPQAYPLLHPAAMAAVAAAAAGYSQHLNGNTHQNALNLASINSRTANPLYSVESVHRGTNVPYVFNPANLHPAVGNYDPYQFTNFTSGRSFTNLNSQPSPHLHSNANNSSVAGLSTLSNPIPRPPVQIPNRAPLPGSSDTSAFSSPKQTNAGVNRQNAKSSARNKRGPASEDMSKKRQEFEELVKARTDKLMSDGPFYTPPTFSVPQTPVGTSADYPSVSEATSGPDYKKLIQDIMDIKKRILLQSPSVVHFLQAQQQSLEQCKQRTELFRASLNK